MKNYLPFICFIIIPLSSIFSQSLFTGEINGFQNYGCLSKYVGKEKKFAIEYNSGIWLCDTSNNTVSRGWDAQFTLASQKVTAFYKETKQPSSISLLEELNKQQFEKLGKILFYKMYHDTINGINMSTYETGLEVNSTFYYYTGVLHSSANGTFQIIAGAPDSSFYVRNRMLAFFRGITKNISVKDNKKIFFNTTTVDTLHPKFSPSLTKPEIFETAFMDGASITQDSRHYDFKTIEIGKIKIESGKVVACDPIGMLNPEPFLREFPIGEFPVQLSLARNSNYDIVAFSRIVFSENPVTKWELAISRGQKHLSLYNKNFYGYGVDAGIGLFIDEVACKKFNTISDSNPCAGDILFKELEKSDSSVCQYLILDFDNHNLACFSTGYGDGTYATYIGFDEKGKPCRLLTDFAVIDWISKKRK